MMPPGGSTPKNAGLRAAQLAIPALYIPSAISVFGFMLAGKYNDWVWIGACVLAAGGFELVNYALSRMDVPAHALRSAQRVRMFSAVTAIVLGWLHHYEQRVPNAWSGAPLDGLAALLALAASLPIVLIALGLGALLHQIGAHDASQGDDAAQLRDERDAAQQEAARVARELAQLRGQLRDIEQAAAQRYERDTQQLRDEAAAARAARDEARGHARQLRDELAQVRDVPLPPAQPTPLDADAVAQALRDAQLDLRDVARVLREHGGSTRDVAQLLGWSESTLRSRLNGERSNGMELQHG